MDSWQLDLPRLKNYICKSVIQKAVSIELLKEM